MGHTAFDSEENLYRLIVRPEPVGIRKVRDPRLRSSMPMPSGAVSKLGVRTTDFLEIGNTATATRSTPSTGRPLPGSPPITPGLS